MIIVEGPDGAGKSTLIRQLSERYGVDVAPRVVSKDTEALLDLKSWVDENLKQGLQWKIFDRYRLISEFIYGPVLRTKQHDGFTDMAWVATRLIEFYSIKPLIIYCMPPLEVVRANVTNDPDNTSVADKIEQIYAGYVHRIGLEIALPRDFSPIVWDYTSDGKEADPLRIFDRHINHLRDRIGKK